MMWLLAWPGLALSSSSVDVTPSVALDRATHVVRGRIERHEFKSVFVREAEWPITVWWLAPERWLLGEPLLIPSFGTPGGWIGDQHLEPAGAPQLADGVDVLVALIQDGTAEHARLASFAMGVFQSVDDAGLQVAVNAWGEAVVDFDCDLGVLLAYPLREADGDIPTCEPNAVFADDPLQVAMPFEDLSLALESCVLGGGR